MSTSFFNNNCKDDAEEIESAKNYADLARDWAIKLDGQVDGIDFSAKFWALQAATSSASKIVIEDDGVPLGSDFNVLNFGVGISVLQTAANEVQIQASGDVFSEIFVDGVDYTAGTSTDIVLTDAPVSEKNIDIYFDGLRQQTDTYDVSGTMVTFNTAIPVGVGSIEVKRPRTLDVGVATAQNILYGATGVTADNFFDQALLTFDNKASMVAALWLVAGMKVRTLGFTTAGDKGQNEYDIGTFGTADGVFIIDLDNGLQAQRIHKVELEADNVQEVKDAPFLYLGDSATFIGYTTPGDGGGNSGDIVAAGTGTDDGGSFIDLPGSGLQFRGLFLSKEADVRQFGATGDGVTNDNSAFANLFSYVTSRDITATAAPGSYNRSGTIYDIDGQSIWYNSAFGLGVNWAQEAEKTSILVTGDTADISPISGKYTRTGINVTMRARGSQHADCVRGTILNFSDDGAGNTGLYMRAVAYAGSLWTSAVHGETRHDTGGTTIGLDSEVATYSTLGTPYGCVLNQTTATAESTHPSGASAIAHPTVTALLVTGGKSTAEMGTWVRGIRFTANSMRDNGTVFRDESVCATGYWSQPSSQKSISDIRLQGEASNGILIQGTSYDNGVGIRLDSGIKIGYEATNQITTWWDSANNEWVIGNGPSVPYGFTLGPSPLGLRVGSEKVLGEQQAAISNSTGGDEQTKINEILVALRAHGLIAS